MTFLNPAALFLLVGAILPLLIHLFSRQRRKDVNFSTLKFLKQLEKKRLRKLKIAEILLLILRMVAISLILLSFARPTLKSGGGLTGKSAAETVFIIDNSLPTQAVSSVGSIISQERATVLNIISQLNGNDKLNFMTNVNPQEILSLEINEESRQDNIRNWIYDIKTTDADPQWEKSLGISTNLLSKSEFPNRELFIVSPFYKLFEQSSALIDSIAEDNIRIYFLQTGPESMNNVAVTDVKFESGIIQKNLPVTVSAVIANFGDENYQNIPISLFVEDLRVASADFNLPPYQKTTLTMKFVPNKSGFYKAEIRLEIDDALIADNRRHLVSYIPEKISIYLFGDEREIQDVNVALNSGKETTSLEVEEVTNYNVPISLNPSRVVFLLGAENITSQMIRIVNDHVKTGGGILVAPSNKMEIATLNRELLSGLDCPQFSRFVEKKISWGNVDLNHPLFAGIFEESPALESPEFIRYAEIVGKAGNNIIEFRNGDPYLTELHCGKGTVLLFTAGFTEYWSDIIHRGIFIPLLHRAATYLEGGILNNESSHTAGQSLVCATKPDYIEFSVTIPDGETRKILPAAESNNSYLEFEETNEAGIYLFKGDSDTLNMFAVNPAVKYSELNRNSKEKIKSVILLDASSPDLYNSILEARIGKELWKLIAILGIILLIIELLIVRLLK